MTIAIYDQSACHTHDFVTMPGLGPARIDAICAALRAAPFAAQLDWRTAPLADHADLALVHTDDHIRAVLAPVPDGQTQAFDFETFATPMTGAAALAAAGAVIDATQRIATGAMDMAFCLSNPGGHHAEADCGLGYCFFNHVGIAAIAAQKRHGLARVAVVDFDAHHGNGTQNLFWNYEDRLFLSIHEDTPPLTGFADETGAWHNIINLPMPFGLDSAGFRRVFSERVMPELHRFAPDMIFVSAGFDMMAGDRLGHMCLGADDYAWVGGQLKQAAVDLSRGRLLANLEGGYCPPDLARAACAFVQGLLET